MASGVGGKVEMGPTKPVDPLLLMLIANILTSSIVEAPLTTNQLADSGFERPAPVSK